MKQSLFAILFIVFITVPCAAQWKTAGCNGRILAFGVHDTSLFMSSLLPGIPNSVSRFIPTGTPSSHWAEADKGIDFKQGNVTSFASLGSYFFSGQTQLDGTKAGSYRSMDNGASWQISGGSPIATNGRYLFSSSETTVYRSRDSGNSWQAVACPGTKNFATVGIFIFANTGSAIWRSMDTGNTWSQISPLFPGDMTIMNTLLFVISGGSVIMSKDSGMNWQAIAVDSVQVHEYVNCIVTDGKILFAGTRAGVYVSTDTGATWHVENDGLGTNLYVNILGVFDTLLFVNVPDNEVYYTAMRPIREMTSPPDAVQQIEQQPTTLSIYPNPLTNTATISYTIAENTRVSITIYNALGETVSIPVPGSYQSAGDHEITLDARPLASGTYWCHLTAGGVERSAKLVIQH